MRPVTMAVVPQSLDGKSGPLLRYGLALSVIVSWELGVTLGGVRHFILPTPSDIVSAFFHQPWFYLGQAGITGVEILVGLIVGAGLGALTAMALSLSPFFRRLFTPALIASQALPVFAIAPLLVIWFGFGMGSKIAMAALIIYFPVATAFADGLRRTHPDLLDLARLGGAGPLATLRLVRLPAALPALGTGLRIAAVIAPIGAVVGEWVGASAGLGFIMLQANARMQTDAVFVALVLLAAMALILRAAVDFGVRRTLFWVPGEQD